MRGNAFRTFGGNHVGVMTGVVGTTEISCFADEVVIDFPSVAPAVDRIRRAFLADEPAATISASLQLSARDAFAGVTMPLEVPVRCTCRQCGGRGESWTESCLTCCGTGEETLRHLLQITIPAGVVDGARFQFTVAARHSPPTRIELQLSVI
jgi:DnaJ-class molecular chaperone